ncbi:alcohol dehydrogenase AdhP [Staphylococcus sp. 47.1]|uniref:alcohol dehydrogenase AdhP n=1 Tax=Staphylococcus sp. 47.1 TaxID=1929484 RepID=UPI0009470CDD|nr:alcohol dehydrogenase AdhP [Staphylococcus sp. 47.1]OLF30226.1 alcohol dehydrogenase AdhP [Staphylococcus sp. 47.1]
MKAAVVVENGKDLEVKDVEVPKPKNNEVLIEIEACGVCHTDLHCKIGDWPVKPDLPVIPGHEGVGKIIELGSNVTNHKVGDRVGLPWLYKACGDCEFCLNGQETLCPYQLNGGYSANGAFAEYAVAPADYAIQIPEGVDSAEIAPVLCAGVTTYKAWKVSGAKPGDWVAIYGIGGLGHLGLQYAKAMGYKVVAVDIQDSKLDFAKKLGADHTVNSKKVDPVEDIKNVTGNGVQASMSVAVNKTAFEQAYHSVKRGGSVVFVALPNEDMPLPIFDTVLNGVSVKGSIVGTRKDQQEALQFAADGKIKTEFKTDKLENINDIFNKMENGEIEGRIVLEF